jgi:hypothetical protein
MLLPSEATSSEVRAANTHERSVVEGLWPKAPQELRTSPSPDGRAVGSPSGDGTVRVLTDDGHAQRRPRIANQAGQLVDVPVRNVRRNEEVEPV